MPIEYLVLDGMTVSSFGASLFDRLEPDGQLRFVGVGRSMEPELQSGDTILVRPIASAPRLGWIVMFHWHGAVLTHRVVRLRGGRFWARGDRSAAVEGPVGFGQIVGRVVGFWRDGCWRSLDSGVDRVRGWVYNTALNATRQAVWRSPQIRRWLEVDGWRWGAARRLGDWIDGWAEGGVTVEREAHPQRVVGAVLSANLPLGADRIKEALKRMRSGRLRLLVAHHPRRGRLGEALLMQERSGRDSSGRVVLSLIRPGIRARGVGSRLLRAVTDEARTMNLKSLFTVVAPDDAWLVNAFERAGYLLGLARDKRSAPAGGGEIDSDGRICLEKHLDVRHGGGLTCDTLLSESGSSECC